MTLRRARWRAGAWIGLILGAIAALWLNRWAILDANLHLLFDLNQAEYGFFSAIQPWLDTPVLELVSDPRSRARFFHDCRGVGNQVHGTLGLAGLALLALVQWFGAPLSTMTLKGMALAQSSAALTFWLVAFARSGVGLRVGLAFAGLFVLAPVVPLKLGMLYWGTHDTILMLAALWSSVVLPWIARPRPGLARLGVAGAVGGLLCLCNYALLMPVLGGLGWLVLESGRAARRRQGLWVLAGGLVAMGCMWLSVQQVLGTGWLDGLGYPRGLRTDHFLLLSGKQGQPFLHRTAALWDQWATWRDVVWPQAMRWAPGAEYGRYAQDAEQAVRVGLVVAGLVALGRWLVWPKSLAPRHRLAAFLGTYLMAAWVGTGVLSLDFGLARGVVTGIQPRYYAHLYPVAFGVLAVWVAGRGALIRGAVLGWVLWLGLWENQRLQDGVDKDVIARYDGARAFFVGETRRVPDVSRMPLADQSDAFIAGLSVIESLQHSRYWQWHRARDLAGAQIILQRFRHHLSAQRGGVPDDPEFWQGVGYALRVALPPSRARADVASFFPEHGEAVRQGYELPPLVWESYSSR